MSSLHPLGIALLTATIGCGADNARPSWVELEQPVDYSILGFSVDERLRDLRAALETPEATDALAGLESQGIAVSVRGFRAVRGSCAIGACRDMYFELVSDSETPLGYLLVENLYDDVPPRASIVESAAELGPVMVFPEPIPSSELAPWLDDQSRALHAALESEEAQGHATRLQADMRETAASLVVTRFVSGAANEGCDACRETFVQLQQHDFGSVAPYTIAVLRIRRFDDAAAGFEVELVDE